MWGPGRFCQAPQCKPRRGGRGAPRPAPGGHGGPTQQVVPPRRSPAAAAAASESREPRAENLREPRAENLREPRAENLREHCKKPHPKKPHRPNFNPRHRRSNVTKAPSHHRRRSAVYLPHLLKIRRWLKMVAFLASYFPGQWKVRFLHRIFKPYVRKGVRATALTQHSQEEQLHSPNASADTKSGLITQAPGVLPDSDWLDQLTNGLDQWTHGLDQWTPRGCTRNAPSDPWRKKPEGEERREDGGQDP